MPGERLKHNFFHMGDSIGGVRCIHCDLERVSMPMPIGFIWYMHGWYFKKKPKCIKRV